MSWNYPDLPVWDALENGTLLRVAEDARLQYQTCPLSSREP